MTDTPHESDAAFFEGTGVVRAHCRTLDWNRTALGPVASWSESLRLFVHLCLDCRTPTALWLGPEFLLIHNDAYAEVLGRKFPSSLGRPIREVWSEVWNELAEDFHKVFFKGESVRYGEAKYRLLRGERATEAYFSYSLTPLRDAHGQILGVFNVMEETTSFVRAKVAREQEYHTLFDRIDEGLCVTAPIRDTSGRPIDYRFLKINPAFVRHTGYVNAVGKTAREVNPQLEPFWPQIVCEVAFTGEPIRLEGHVLSLERWFDVFIFRVDDECDGRVALLFNEITSRKRSEAALRHSEELLRAIVSASSDVVYRMTPDWSEIRQLNGREFIGETSTPVDIWIERYVPFDDRARVKAAIMQAVSKKGSFELEHRALRSDGSAGWALSRAVPLLDSHQKILEWIGATTDITDRKTAQLALEQANARLQQEAHYKNEFLAMLSHELRNPLTPIKNSLYVLGRVPQGGEQARRAKEVIERQVDQLTRLVDDLLDVTRISRGKVQLQRRTLELGDLVQRTLEDHRTLFENAGVDLQLDPCAEPVRVYADWSRIAQVLGNLLQNSAKFTPRAGWVKVTVSADPSRALAAIRVSDNGIGISPEILSKLFVPFTQADASLDRSKGGLGLGLALVRSLVELHGGSVEARSAGVGQGSEFTVWLPLDTTSPRDATSKEAGGALTRRRVLIVEDNADAAATLREVMELQGHEVLVAYDGPDGVKMARVFQPDVVFCDIGLPGMDGYAVAHRLRAEPNIRKPRLVALSGYALPEDLDRSARAGFDRHIAKPADLDELARILGEILPGERPAASRDR